MRAASRLSREILKSENRGVLYEQAFEEQEKQVKYTGLLTNCIILDNTIEISTALNTLAKASYLLSIDEVAPLSSYQTKHIKRFGNYEIDFEAVPPLNADDLTFTLELPAPLEVVEMAEKAKQKRRPPTKIVW